MFEEHDYKCESGWLWSISDEVNKSNDSIPKIDKVLVFLNMVLLPIICDDVKNSYGLHKLKSEKTHQQSNEKNIKPLWAFSYVFCGGGIWGSDGKQSVNGLLVCRIQQMGS
jgi:hypothetical protein